MATAYLCLVHDYGHQYLTGFLLVFVQTAFIGYITDCVNIGKTAASGHGFIPIEYDPSESDVAFVGAMGILGVLCYGTFFVGSLAFMAFSIYAFQAGKPGDRAAGYYLGRLSFYSLLLIIVGLAQLMLGSYILSNFGSGPLPNGAISVAMFVVYFPEISVFVGLVYVLNGLFGLGRYFSVLPSSPDNHTFQLSIGFQYLCTLLLMIITQFSLSPGAGYAAAAPSVACLTLGAHILPAFLDYSQGKDYSRYSFLCILRHCAD